MNTKRITPAQYVVSMLALLIFVVFETDTFKEVDESVLVSIYAAMLILSTLLEFKGVDLKRFAVKIKDVWLDPGLSGWAKITKIFSLVIPLLIEANEEYDLLNLEQFQIDDIQNTLDPTSKKEENVLLEKTEQLTGQKIE